jgi:hypothetical protein
MPHLPELSPQHLSFPRMGRLFLKFPGQAKLSGNGSQLVFDLGIEVGGLVTLEYFATVPGAIGLAFTEVRTGSGSGQIHPMEASRHRTVQFMPTSVPHALIPTRCPILGSAVASVT